MVWFKSVIICWLVGWYIIFVMLGSLRTTLARMTTVTMCSCINNINASAAATTTFNYAHAQHKQPNGIYSTIIQRRVQLQQHHQRNCSSQLHTSAVQQHGGAYEMENAKSEDDVVNITYVLRDGERVQVRGKVGDNVMYLAHR